MPDGSVVRSGTNYSGKFQEAHDASKASIQSRVSNLESGGVKVIEAEVPPAFKQENLPVHMNQDSSKHRQKRIQMSF